MTEQSAPPQKKMLNLSVHPHGAGGVLRIEREDYYSRRSRVIKTEYAPDSFQRADILQDPVFYKGIMWWLTMGLFGPNNKEENHTWSSLIYPHFRGRNPVLRLDREFYLYRPYREHCADLDLMTLDFDVLSEDDSFQSQLARAVLGHLPPDQIPDDVFFVETPQKLDEELNRLERNPNNIAFDHLPPFS